MHFALPPRKSSHPPPYVRAAAVRSASNQRRKLFQLGSYFVLGILTLYLLFHYFFSSPRTSHDDDEALQVPHGGPEVVIVTVFDHDKMSEDYIQKIKTNREDYAARHGYTNFFTNTTFYHPVVHPSPKSWSTIPALRHALTLYPTTPWLFSLSPHALIMSPTISLSSHIYSAATLAALMRRDIPAVPPDSVIHTFSHLTSVKTHLILTQDVTNLVHHSLLLRNSEWAKFFLDTWFDPLYRAYNFQKAEGHALEHVVQWHPTVLAKIVIVPQRVMNSYNILLSREEDDEKGEEDEEELEKEKEGLFQSGDLLVRFVGCELTRKRDCEGEMKPYWEQWKEVVGKLDAGDGKMETYQHV